MYGEIDTHTKKVHVKFVRNTHPTNQNDCENVANQRQIIDSTSQSRETGVRLSVTSKQRKPKKKKNMQEEEPKFILLEGTIDEFIDE